MIPLSWPRLRWPTMLVLYFCVLSHFMSHLLLTSWMHRENAVSLHFTASTSSLKQSVMLKDRVLVQLGGSILALMLCMTTERWKALSCLCALQSRENTRAGAGALRWQARQMQAEPWPLHIHSGLQIKLLSWLLALSALTGNRCSSRTFCEASGWSNP